ncbi:hypothetical protein [Brachybacterium sp. Z12]|uniref:SRPBCC family protein n=1 Tax=Brachybacterium sp. Z12 TaxID=2759167 RepID=UPI00223B129C|nr:hypothetical protein [Brachybacterium sp. Z12]
MRIEAVHRVPHPRSEVLAWHDKPGALVRLTPPGLASAEAPATGGMQAGRLVGVRMGPPALPTALRPRWILRHAEHEPEGRFVDQQVHGPWRTWRHEHRIDDTADGSATEIHDSIDLELPRHSNASPRSSRPRCTDCSPSGPGSCAMTWHSMPAGRSCRAAPSRSPAPRG